MKANNMLNEKPGSPASNSQARLSEIMDVLDRLERKLRTDEEMDLDALIDIINVVREKLVSSMSRAK